MIDVVTLARYPALRYIGGLVQWGEKLNALLEHAPTSYLVSRLPVAREVLLLSRPHRVTDSVNTNAALHTI
jgi:hypothetical protein